MEDFKFNVSKTADTLMTMAGLFNCSLKEAWETYMHPVITEQTTFEEVEKFIKDKVALGEKYEAK